MTGYGRAEAEISLGHLTVEIKSVNHRFLDSRVRLPRQISSLETSILNYLKGPLSRGRIEINMSLAAGGELDLQPTLNIPLAKEYQRLVGQAAEALDVADTVPLEVILRMPDVIQTSDSVIDPEEVWEEARPVLDRAIEALKQMRDREGKALAEDFRKTLQEISEYRDKLESLKAVVVQEYRERLQNRLNALLSDNGGLDEGRLHQEVALFADRSDISEELARLDSHLHQFAEILEVPEPVGRRLDFLLQEMFREINTIGSKANHLEVKQASLEMKNCVERLREQAQNVE
jgi:uncharacterized protein (TIGR00255 family)